MPAERVEDHPFSLQPAQKWDDASEQWVHDIPDLTDPATLGCLLALVREAWAEPTMHVRWNAGVGRWDVVARYSFPACAKTEAEALIAALEAAPCGR